MAGRKGLKLNVRNAIWMQYISMVKPGRGSSGSYALAAAGNLHRVPGDLKSGTGRCVRFVESRCIYIKGKAKYSDSGVRDILFARHSRKLKGR